MDSISAWCDPEQLDATEVVRTVLATVDRARQSVRVNPSNAYELLERSGSRFVSRKPAELWQEILPGLRDFDALAAKDRLSFLAQQSREALLDVSHFVDLSDRIITDLETCITKESEVNVDLPRRIKAAIKRLHGEFEQINVALRAVSQIDLESPE